MLFANCHLHSTFSDGFYTPEQLVELAQSVGHKALILTDHDTISGTYRMQQAARKAGLLTMLACEFSSVGLGTDFHIVGIDFNPEDKAIRKFIALGAARSTEYAHVMFDRGLALGTLRQGLTWEDVRAAYPYHDYLCNNHVFNLMVEKGIYKEHEYYEFFTGTFRWSEERQQIFESETGLIQHDVAEIISAIRNAGGIAIIAHPHQKQPYTDALLEMGAMGFEVLHPGCDEADKAFYRNLCREKGLYISGGTDHSSLLGGFAKDNPKLDVPPETGYTTEEDFMNMYLRKLG